MASRKVNISANSGTGGTTSFYYDTVTHLFYATSDFSQPPITSITMHTRECFASLGYRTTASDTGVIAVNADGTINADYVPSSSTNTIYARWSRVSYKITASRNGGLADKVFYRDISSPTFYIDDLCTVVTTRIDLTTRVGYTCTGVYSSTSGGTQYVDENGTITESLYSLGITSDKTFPHRWTANTYTLNFDYSGGAGQTSSKTVKYGIAIGSLPTATNQKGVFSGWTLNGVSITSETIWNVASDATAVAQYNLYFGSVVDYFSLGSSTLIPESSDSGDTHVHNCVYNNSELPPPVYEETITETGGVWRNPTVTYRVVGDMTLNVLLGKAFTGSTNLSGYMITSVTVNTAVGESPTVVVSGVANEGANAVKTYQITIPVSSRHRPQNILNALNMTNHGDLIAMSLTALADPVVLAENNMPCASDVCHGKMEISATSCSYANEAAPTPSNGSGFVRTSELLSSSGVGYKSWKTQFRKDVL